MSPSLRRWVNLLKTWYGAQRSGKLETPPNFHTRGGLRVTRLAYPGQWRAKTATPRLFLEFEI